MLVFRNPANGYEETTNNPGLWCLLFGSLYFISKGIWGHALLSAVLAFATFGISWLIYPVFARKIVTSTYNRRGWIQVTGLKDQVRETRAPSSEDAKGKLAVLNRTLNWALGAAVVIALLYVLGDRHTAAPPSRPEAARPSYCADKRATIRLPECHWSTEDR
jgi:hypothetical protein